MSARSCAFGVVCSIPLILSGSLLAQEAVKEPTPIPENVRLEDLVPRMPSGVLRPWKLVADLDQVPEVSLYAPMSPTLSPDTSRREIALMVEKMRRLEGLRGDREGSHAYLARLRPDLRGLPFDLEDLDIAPRLLRHFTTEYREVSDSVVWPTRSGTSRLGVAAGSALCGGLGGALGIQGVPPAMDAPGVIRTERYPFDPAIDPSGPLIAKSDAALEVRVRAAVQVLFPLMEGGRMSLVQHLHAIPHRSASRELARVALFAPEEKVRAAAIRALKVRRESDYSEQILEGFNYPLDTVAENAADAVIRLRSLKLLMQVAPILETINGDSDSRFSLRANGLTGPAPYVREVVKVNHHRNCLLCHPPCDREAIQSSPRGRAQQEFFLGRIPSPSEPLPFGAAYYESFDADQTVRFDVTYLRQDFSLLLPVADASPWPVLQRFDFVVRERPLNEEEANRLRAMQPFLPRPPNHRAALRALRETTGWDHVEPTRAAWAGALKRGLDRKTHTIP